MAIKKFKKAQDANKIFTSLKGIECIFKNSRKTPLPRATLAKQRPVDKSTKPKCFDTDLGNKTKHLQVKMTLRSEILWPLYFVSGFPVLATESYTVCSQVLRGRGAKASTKENEVDSG